MHYNETQLQNQITNARIKPVLTLDTFDFTTAFHQFLERMDIEYYRLHQGDVVYLNENKTKAETSFAIEYGQYGDSRTIYVSAENQGTKWMYTFNKVSYGSVGSLNILDDKIREDEEEEHEWSAIKKTNGIVACYKCEEQIGIGSAYSSEFKPVQNANVLDIYVESFYENGNSGISLSVHVVCQNCQTENVFSSKQDLE